MQNLTARPEEINSASCEDDLRAHGENHKGVGYNHSEQQARDRYALMLDVIRPQFHVPGAQIDVLDVGCGLAGLFSYIRGEDRFRHLSYRGIDISPAFLDAARRSNPEADLRLVNILNEDAANLATDYGVINGLFNYRGPVPYQDMLRYWQDMVEKAFSLARHGIAFNVMSKIVDWERDDLFHLPFEVMSAFVAARLSRHFVIRHDYAAREYTVYVYRTPSSL